MADILVSELQAQLGDDIAIDTTAFPANTTALKVVAAFNQAVLRAQIAQNATAPTGEDVQLVAYQAGAETTITRDSVVHNVRPATYQYTMYEKIQVADVLPTLI